ncbi:MULTISPECIES: pyruvate dehydrogenase complex dihydrolipoamide acetyltransferase [unclassified Arthrobacter]|uniref:pyruvate dehydrogenase complex dihydrolipoamide acetyltransferase n=1 Tax=unclassified Arthrobacter TaxID=235627 RepID=UPI0003AB43F3|nr:MULTISPECIES: pyruvate dehydrogenase complex dihydrolipoamide acetyltransferase [unclassified Arthrobacter]BCW54342.1 acetyltransferase component of pyruvate dehydrogenase complex [Arthrobacter sp. StoSoilB19]
MPALMNMPEVMANATEAALSTWLKREGDKVSVGESIAEVETEKATVEIEAESEGIVARLLVEEGTNVDVGAPILIIRASGDTDAEVAALLESVQNPTDSTDSPSGTAPQVPSETTPAEATETNTPIVESPITQERDVTPPPVNTGNVHGRIFASPLARRVAKDNDLDVASIAGTGPNGRIIRRDVEKAVQSKTSPTVDEGAGTTASPTSTVTPDAAPQHAAAEQPRPGAGPVSVPHTRMRRTIARRLTESKSTVPHFYLTADVKMDALLALRQQINTAATRRITVNDLVVKAAGLALHDVPEANVSWTEDAQLQYATADISVAIAVDGGLLTPVVRAVESQPLISISTTIGDFVERAKAGKIRQDELAGGSFSITNLGMFGTKQFSAILNPPQSAILAVGAAEPRAVVNDGELVIANIMTCTLSADHRVIDGAVAAQWMNAFKSRVENPLTMLL